MLITGASRGIGLALVAVFSHAGYDVIACHRSIECPEELACLKCSPLHLDVTNQQSINNAMQKLSAIDVLINNAGYAVAGTVEEVDITQAKDMFDVNVWGLIRVAKAVIPIMRSQKSGLIVNMSSIAGHLSHDGMGIYSASKHSVEALTDALALELKPFGIRVIDIEPSAVATDFGSSSLKGREVLENKQSPYASMYAAMRKDFANLHQGMDRNDLAKEILTIITSPNSPRHNPVGSAVFLKRLDKFAPQLLKNHLENKIIKERWKQ